MHVLAFCISIQPLWHRTLLRTVDAIGLSSMLLLLTLLGLLLGLLFQVLDLLLPELLLFLNGVQNVGVFE